MSFGYQPNLDVTVQELGIANVSDTARIIVTLRRYDDATPNVCLEHQRRTRGGEWVAAPSRLRRLSLEEHRAIAALLVGVAHLPVAVALPTPVPHAGLPLQERISRLRSSKDPHDRHLAADLEELHSLRQYADRLEEARQSYWKPTSLEQRAARLPLPRQRKARLSGPRAASEPEDSIPF